MNSIASIWQWMSSSACRDSDHGLLTQNSISVTSCLSTDVMSMSTAKTCRKFKDGAGITRTRARPVTENLRSFFSSRAIVACVARPRCQFRRIHENLIYSGLELQMLDARSCQLSPAGEGSALVSAECSATCHDARARGADRILNER